MMMASFSYSGVVDENDRREPPQQGLNVVDSVTSAPDETGLNLLGLVSETSRTLGCESQQDDEDEEDADSDDSNRTIMVNITTPPPRSPDSSAPHNGGVGAQTSNIAAQQICSSFDRAQMSDDIQMIYDGVQMSYDGLQLSSSMNLGGGVQMGQSSTTGGAIIATSAHAASSSTYCANCAQLTQELNDSAVKAQFLMNYIDKTDAMFNIKVQLEKERDQLKRQLDEKDTYIEAQKKEEENLRCKLIKAMDEKDDLNNLRKEMLDVVKRERESTEKISYFRATNEQLTTLLQDKSRSVDEWRNKHDQLNQQLIELNVIMKQKNEKLDDLTAKREKQSTKLANLTTDLKELKEKSEEESKTLSENFIRAAKLSYDFAKLSSRYVRLTKPLERELRRCMESVKEMNPDQAQILFDNNCLSTTATATNKHDSSFSSVAADDSSSLTTNRNRLADDDVIDEEDGGGDDVAPLFPEKEPLRRGRITTKSTGNVRFVDQPTTPFAENNNRRGGRKRKQPFAAIGPFSDKSENASSFSTSHVMSEAAKKARSNWQAANAVAPPAFKPPPEAVVRQPTAPCRPVQGSSAHKKDQPPPPLKPPPVVEISLDRDVSPPCCEIPLDEILRKCCIRERISPIRDIFVPDIVVPETSSTESALITAASLNHTKLLEKEVRNLTLLIMGFDKSYRHTGSVKDSRAATAGCDGIRDNSHSQRANTAAANFVGEFFVTFRFRKCVSNVRNLAERCQASNKSDNDIVWTTVFEKLLNDIQQWLSVQYSNADDSMLVLFDDRAILNQTIVALLALAYLAHLYPIDDDRLRLLVDTFRRVTEWANQLRRRRERDRSSSLDVDKKASRDVEKESRDAEYVPRDPNNALCDDDNALQIADNVSYDVDNNQSRDDVANKSRNVQNASSDAETKKSRDFDIDGGFHRLADALRFAVLHYAPMHPSHFADFFRKDAFLQTFPPSSTNCPTQASFDRFKACFNIN